MKTNLSRLLGSLALTAIFAISAHAETVTFKNTTGGYDGAKDTRIQEGKPNDGTLAQAGMPTSVNASSVATRTLISFDISSLIPEGSDASAIIIDSIDLKLWTRSNTNAGDGFVLDLVGMTSDFTPGDATWNTMNDQYNATVLSSISFSSGTHPENTTFLFNSTANLTAFVQDALINNNGIINLMIKLPDLLEDGTTAYSVTFESDTSGRHDRRPEFIISYTVIPEPGTVALGFAALAATLGVLRLRKRRQA